MPSVLGGVLRAATTVEVQVVLPVTGSSIPMWIPIVGGIVLLLGVAALVFTIVSRRRLGTAESTANPVPDVTDESAVPPTA